MLPGLLSAATVLLLITAWALHGEAEIRIRLVLIALALGVGLLACGAWGGWWWHV